MASHLGQVCTASNGGISCSKRLVVSGSDLKLTLIESYFGWLYKRIQPESLGLRPSWPEAEKDILAAEERSSPGRFLGFYTIDGIRRALEHYGIFEQLARRGFERVSLELKRHEQGFDILRLFAEGVDEPLAELVAEVGPLSWEAQRICPAAGSRFLHIRWLCLQDPRPAVKEERPLLPGQRHPGLGLGREILVLLQMICARLNLDGLAALPERLHNAIMYFKRFYFLDPALQGVLTAILRDTRRNTLLELAWGVEAGVLYDAASGKPFRWLPQYQVLARRGPVQDFILSAAYQNRAREVMERVRFFLSTGDLALEEVMQKSLAESPPWPTRIK